MGRWLLTGSQLNKERHAVLRITGATQPCPVPLGGSLHKKTCITFAAAYTANLVEKNEGEVVGGKLAGEKGGVM